MSESQIDFVTGAPAQVSLDVAWIHGVPAGRRATDPPVQVHHADPHTVILRQGKSVNFEAPFLYLLFGNDRALLLDTGATADPAKFPLRATIDELVAEWLARHPRDAYQLVVAHTHGHHDHHAADAQFAGRAGTVVVARELEAVQQFFGFTGWPEQIVPFDLGGRVLEVTGSPGHHPAAITVYDPWTGFLLTGDTVLPGRLYAFDFPQFTASIDRMVTLAGRRQVTHVLGCHIEMTADPGRDYPLGATYQPRERSLQMTVDQLRDVQAAAASVAGKQGVHRFDDFVIYNQPGPRDQLSLMAHGLLHKLRARVLRRLGPPLNDVSCHDPAHGRRGARRLSAVKEVTLPRYRVVEVCAGAGGQSLGLEIAGFEHELAVELDQNACATLRHNRPHWKVAQGDVASLDVWDPAAYAGVDLLAGGVPCPPFTIAGKQLGATDERDLFAWAIELCRVIGPRALLLENVRGLSLPRFAAYRQHVLDRLAELGYAADWRLLHAADYGVPQLRPRFVLVAMRPDDFAYFTWPEPHPGRTPTVGETLLGLMAGNGWPGAAAWAAKANDIAPTIVGGSKKHGGPDLGPTRAKRAWRTLGVDALGVADAAPSADDPVTLLPKLTCEMVARIQGWDGHEYPWEFTGRKTSNYRQIGNAFPPPVARELGDQVRRALDHDGAARDLVERSDSGHDPVYAVLRDDGGFLTMEQVLRRLASPLDVPAFERHLAHLKRDFHIDVRPGKSGDAYRLGAFKAFVGQDDHLRHEAFIHPARIS